MPFALLMQEALGALPWFSMIWRPVVAAAAMFAALALGWNVQPLLALIVSVPVYLGALLVLRPLNADELARLMPLLPARLRRVVASLSAA